MIGAQNNIIWIWYSQPKTSAERNMYCDIIMCKPSKKPAHQGDFKYNVVPHNKHL